jgi:hypothetical protein
MLHIGSEEGDGVFILKKRFFQITERQDTDGVNLQNKMKFTKLHFGL